MRRPFRLFRSALFLLLFSAITTTANAQASLSSAGTVPPPSAASSGQPTSADLLKPEQIDALVAPIALYPDPLLSQVLIASTYPLEVVESARWVKTNSNLKGDALKAAVDQQTWDQSVKSLAATPSVLQMMSDKLDWTQKLGDAVLAQQADVMDAVQRLRARADANNKLMTTKQQKVIKTKENNKDVIVIEPAEPNTVYVPYYNPAVVYGAWPYSAYPPYYWGAPGYVAGAAIATGIAFGAGYAIGRWTSGGWGWGGGFAWGNNNINFNRQININSNGNNFISGQTWHHDPAHRHGVQYHNAAVRQQFSGNRTQSGRAERMDFRGHNGQQVLRPDAGNRPGRGNKAGNRPGSDRAGRDVANRGKARATRPANRPNAASRRHEGAFSHMGRGDFAHASAARGRASFGAGPRRGGMRGGGFHGGGFHGGGFHRR